MFCIEGYNRSTGKRWQSDILFDDEKIANDECRELNNMEGRMTDGVVYVSYTVKELKE